MNSRHPLQYSLHAPRRGREDVRNFMVGFREAFPDINSWGRADLIAEGEYVVGRWEGGGSHTGPAFSGFLVGSLRAASGLKMRFTGTTVLRVVNGKNCRRDRPGRRRYRTSAAWHPESCLTGQEEPGGNRLGFPKRLVGVHLFPHLGDETMSSTVNAVPVMAAFGPSQRRR
jgi:hypothetical protein